MAGWLDYSVLGVAPLWLILVFVLVIALAVVYAYRKSTSDDRKDAKKVAAVVAVLVIVVLLVGMIPQAAITPTNVAEASLSISATADASCFDFPDFSGDGDCNPATPTTDIVVNDADKTVALGLTTDYSANALYALATTTAFDTTGVTFVIRRTDDGWRENGQLVSLAVSGSVSGLTSWVIKGNVSGEPDIFLVEKNAQGIFQIAWTDENSNTIVGEENGGGLALLAPAGDSATIRLAFYFNEDALPRSIQFATYTFSATITIAMDEGPSFSIPVTLTLQSQA